MTKRPRYGTIYCAKLKLFVYIPFVFQYILPVKFTLSLFFACVRHLRKWRRLAVYLESLSLVALFQLAHTYITCPKFAFYASRVKYNNK